MERKSIYHLAISLVISIAAAAIGSIPITLGGGIAWQDTLHKPFYAPPNGLFGPAWTVLFLLMALALFLVLQKWPHKNAKIAVYLYLVQIVLNVLWNFVFFGARLILPGLVEIIVLLIFIAATVYAFHRVDRRAAWLLVPYLLWVCFAAALNMGIWLLNP